MLDEGKLYRTRKGQAVRVRFIKAGRAYYDDHEHWAEIGVSQKTGRYYEDGRLSRQDVLNPLEEFFYWVDLINDCRAKRLDPYHSVGALIRARELWATELTQYKGKGLFILGSHVHLSDLE